MHTYWLTAKRTKPALEKMWLGKLTGLTWVYWAVKAQLKKKKQKEKNPNMHVTVVDCIEMVIFSSPVHIKYRWNCSTYHGVRVRIIAALLGSNLFLTILVKVFNSLYLLNGLIGLLDIWPDVRYWSEVLCCTTTTAPPPLCPRTPPPPPTPLCLCGQGHGR